MDGRRPFAACVSYLFEVPPVPLELARSDHDVVEGTVGASVHRQSDPYWHLSAIDETQQLCRQVTRSPFAERLSIRGIPNCCSKMDAELQQLLQTMRGSYGPRGRCFTALVPQTPSLQRETHRLKFIRYIAVISVASFDVFLVCCRPHAVKHAGESGRSVTSRGYTILKWFPASALQLKVAVGALMSTAAESRDCSKFGALLALRSVHHARHVGHLVVVWRCSVCYEWSGSDQGLHSYMHTCLYHKPHMRTWRQA